MRRRPERSAGKWRDSAGERSRAQSESEQTGRSHPILKHSRPLISKVFKVQLGVAGKARVRAEGEQRSRLCSPHSSVSSRSRCVLD